MSFSNQKIVKIELLYQVQENISPEQKQERSIALYDLMENNSFHLIGHKGPYHLYLSKQTRHLLFEIKSLKEIPINSFYLALGPFRKLIRDYNQICDSYYEAIRTKPPSQIQAIDVGRKALHDEGANLVIERLRGKIEINDDTARRLFTLISILRSKQ